jgi:hypothetical protein
MVGAGWKDIWNHGASPRGSNILRTVHEKQSITAFKWLVGPLGPTGCGSPGAGLFDEGSLRPMTKIDPSRTEGGEPPSTV